MSEGLTYIKEALANGDNFLWLAFDLQAFATHCNIVDAEVLSFVINFSPATSLAKKS